jgi:hypothetical protein
MLSINPRFKSIKYLEVVPELLQERGELKSKGCVNPMHRGGRTSLGWFRDATASDMQAEVIDFLVNINLSWGVFELRW